ncbi:hypothetical protein BDW22DRAFT_1425659 [Trametopsis cervina]|nr:hypothetical protein BDW22DRAFT_1425659 [Trametopsis cervina]
MDWAQQASAMLNSGDISAERFYQLAMAEDIAEAQMKMLLGFMQRLPRPQQDPVWHELAAKYLPQLVERWRADDSGPLTPSMRIINVISYTPYFIRFLGTPAGRGIAALHLHRVLQFSEALTDASDADSIAEVNQFLATMLLVQGIADVDAEEKKAVLVPLRAWVRKPAFRGKLASDASERVVWLLTEDRGMAVPLEMVRSKLREPLEGCAAPGCTKTLSTHNLQKCSRCKTALFCDKEHQKFAWPSHKKLCFEPTF